MASPAFEGLRALVLDAGSHRCALPLAHVLETLRPLPIEAIAGAPATVLGLAVIRGAPVPVVDLAAALGSATHGDIERFVTIQVGDRRVALAVSSVLGVREIAASTLESMPPLVEHAAGTAVDALGRLDAQLLLVLRAARVVPDGLDLALGDAGAR